MLADPPFSAEELAALQAAGLGEVGAKLLRRIEHDRQEIDRRDVKLEKLSFEIAQLRRLKFGRKSEQLDAEQRALFDEALDADIAAAEAQLQELLGKKKPPASPGERPKRAALPPNLPRVDRHHEPENTTCACGCALKRIGEDVSERVDYAPGVFTVERHIRGKWACAKCRTLTQAPVPVEIIDKGIPTSGLLAQVLVAKYADHLALYRQEAIFGRAGVALPRSTLGAWIGVCGLRLQPLIDALKAHILACPVVHADETPVAMLSPGSGKTHRAYLWAYAAGAFEPLRAVVYDFTESRAGEHARAFLGDWRGSLVCDDYTGYKASFALGVTEAGCMAHARRNFVELHEANKSTIAAAAIDLIGQLYGIEREVKLRSAQQRLHERRTRAGPIAKALHDWLLAQRGKITDGTATAKAIDYSLNRWAALTRYLDDPALPIDNNHDEQQIRPWATGRKNWLFAGTLLAGQRAAAIMSLIQSAKLNGHDPYAYLKDVLQRLPTQRACDIDELVPHRCNPRTHLQRHTGRAADLPRRADGSLGRWVAGSLGRWVAGSLGRWVERAALPLEYQHMSALSWQDLFVDARHLDFGALLAEWGGLVGGPVRPIGASVFGDLFFERRTGEVEELDVLEGGIHRVAASFDEFTKLMNCVEWQTHNLLSEGVALLKDRGVSREAGQFFGFAPHPALAGKIVWSSVMPLDFVVWNSICAQLLAAHSAPTPDSFGSGNGAKRPWWKFGRS